MYPLHLFVLTCVVAVQTASGDSTGAITGAIRDTHGQPVVAALIQALGIRRQAQPDSQGHYDLRGLPVGPVRVRIDAIGYHPADTSLSLGRGQRVVWNVALREPEWLIEAARQESLSVAAGGLDSISAGLVATDTTSGFTYTGFGVRLLQAAIERSSTDTNRVLSPLSAGQALALALGAAKDSTALAIAAGLELGSLGSDGIAARSKRFNDAVRTRRDVTLKVANALWVDTSATLQPSFADWARVRYGAAIRSQPLTVPEIVPIINRWADSTTNHAIPKIRDEPFGRLVEVVLTNAVYFKGRWLAPFDSTRTQDRPFRTASGQQIAARTMERTTGVAYRRGAQYQVVRVPYSSGLTALYIVLPDTGTSATHVLAELAKGGWPLPDARRDVRTVEIRLPKLHVTQATDLRPPLTDLGMGIVFDSKRADFGGLVVPRPDRPPPCPPLSSGIVSDDCTRYRINEADQHVFLDVDEQGTVAAAVTTIGFQLDGVAVPPPPIKFYVDRPFFFALRDERTGTMLFVGYIANPRQ